MLILGKICICYYIKSNWFFWFVWFRFVIIVFYKIWDFKNLFSGYGGFKFCFIKGY